MPDDAKIISAAMDVLWATDEGKKMIKAAHEFHGKVTINTRSQKPSRFEDNTIFLNILDMGSTMYVRQGMEGEAVRHSYLPRAIDAATKRSDWKEIERLDQQVNRIYANFDLLHELTHEYKHAADSPNSGNRSILIKEMKEINGRLRRDEDLIHFRTLMDEKKTDPASVYFRKHVSPDAVQKFRDGTLTNNDASSAIVDVKVHWYDVGDKQYDHVMRGVFSDAELAKRDEDRWKRFETERQEFEKRRVELSEKHAVEQTNDLFRKEFNTRLAEGEKMPERSGYSGIMDPTPNDQPSKDFRIRALYKKLVEEGKLKEGDSRSALPDVDPPSAPKPGLPARDNIEKDREIP